MKSIPVVVGIVLLMVFALGWFLFNRDEAQTPLDQPEIEVQDEAQQPKRNSDHSNLEVSDARALAEAADLQGPDENKVIEVAEDVDAILVRVAIKDNDEAVGGIDVYVFNEESLARMSRMRPRSEQDLTDRIMRLGKHHRTDPRGLVRIEPPAGRFGVLAYSDKLFGSSQVQAEAQDVLVQVEAYATVKVRVVDWEGKPVPATAVVSRIYHNRFDVEVAHDVAYCQTSGPEGIAHLKLLNMPKGDSIHRSCVALSGVFEHPIEHPIDLQNPPKETITLVLPPTGSIVVRVEGQNRVDGNESYGSVSVTLKPDNGGEVQEFNDANRISVFLEDGLGRADWLALGREFEVSYDPGPNSRFERMTQTVVGPKTAAEVIEVVFTLSDDPTRCVILGRAIDEEGKPLCKTEIRTRSELRTESGAGSQGGQIKTQEDGTFEASFDVEVTEGETRWLLRFSVLDSSRLERRFEMDFTGRGPGIYDLGDVPLLPDPVLVRGRVLGPDGEGLPDITLILSPVQTEEEEVERQFSGNDMRAAVGSSGKDGRFEVRGDIEGSEFELRAHAEGFEFDGMRVNRGQEGVLVRMTALARLTAQFLPWAEHAGTGLEGFLFGLRPEGEPHRGGSGLPRGGHLDVYKKSGRYDLSIAHNSDMMKVLLERKGLVLEAGRTLDLGEIQLDPPGIEVQLLIRTESREKNVPRHRVRGSIRTFEVGSTLEIQENYVSLQERPQVLYVERLPIDVEVEMKGFRAQRWTLKQKRQKVLLKPGLEVHLKVNGLSGLPEDAVVSLNLGFVELREDGRQSWRFGILSVDAEMTRRSPETTAILAKPGTYQVRVSVGFSRNGATTMRGIRQKELVTIQVLDKDAPQRFDINLDPTEVAETLSSLSEER